MGTVSTDIPENADTASRIQIDPVLTDTDILYAQHFGGSFPHRSEMATNSVRKLFMDAARESQHRVGTASASSGHHLCRMIDASRRSSGGEASSGSKALCSCSACL